MSSKFNQNSVIMCLEDALPLMQKSDDPIGTLLKYAKEKRLSPAQLERVGHMFNALKTNSIYNLAKNASDRGIYFTTLDVPELLNRYASFTNDEIKILSSHNKNNAQSDKSNMGKNMNKQASIHKEHKVGDIKDLFIEDALKNEDELAAVETLNKTASEIIENFDKKYASYKIIEQNIGDGSNEYKFNIRDNVDYIEACKVAKQHCLTEIMKSVKVMDSITSKFANIYNSRKPKYASFDKIEHAAVLCSDNSSEVKEAMEDLAGRLKTINNWLSSTVKTATETGLYDKYKIAEKEPEEIDDIKLYTEAYKQCKEASQFKKELEDDIEKFAAKIKDFTSLTAQDFAADPKYYVDELQNLAATDPNAVKGIQDYVKTIKELGNLVSLNEAQNQYNKNKVKEQQQEAERQKEIRRKDLLFQQGQDDRAYLLKRRAIEEAERALREQEHAEDRDYLLQQRDIADEDRKYTLKQREIAEKERALRDKEHAEDRKYTLKQREIAEKDRRKAELKQLGSILSSSATDVGNLVNKTTENALAAAKAIGANYSDIFRQVDEARALNLQNAMMSPIQKKLKDLEDRVVLEQLLYTDPVLSKLSDSETDNLMDIYNTIVRRNPEVGNDIGLLRSLLRQAVAANGIDINALKTIEQLNNK